MSNLISEANELLNQYALTGDRDFFYSKMLECLNRDIAECIVTISVPTKGEKPNG